MRGLGKYWRDRRGGITLIAAFSITAILAFAALAVDLGSIFLQTRQLQGMADLAAIGAANDLQNAQAAAVGTAGANEWNGPVQTAVVVGTYTPSSSIPMAQRFVTGGTSPNAAKVTLTAQANLFFGQPILGKQTITISRTGTAASAQMASFSLGSGLLTVQGGIANSLLSALTGSQVSLSVMNYNALASANVDLLQFSNALQTQLNLTGASYNQVLATRLTTGQALTVLGQVLNSEGQGNAATAVNQIAAAAGSASTASSPFKMQQLVNLGPYGAQDHSQAATGAGISVNAMDFATAILQVAQGGRQVKLALGTSVPGLANVDAWLAIGQRPSTSPWLTVAQDGSIIVQTAQMRLYVDAQIAPATGALTGAGASLVNIPILVQVASAQAKLNSISCATSITGPSVSLLVQPSIGQINLGQINTATLNDFTQPVTVSPAALVNLPLLQVTGSAQTNLGGVNWQTVNFSQSDIQAQTIKTVSTNDIAQGLAASLLPNTQIGVQLLGLNLGLGNLPITSAVQQTLTTAAPSLDQAIDAITNLLGVQLGVAYVSVNGVRCHNSALVL